MHVTLYDHHTSICSQMARLALTEKGVAFTRHPVNIGADTNEQFEPWYVALNPRAVVPTLKHDETVVTDTLRICDYVDITFAGPALRPDSSEAAEENTRWMKAIMAPHYGVLLYGPMVDEDGRCRTIEARHQLLSSLRDAASEGPRRELLERRVASNVRFQEILANPEARHAYVKACHDLVRTMEAPLASHAFLVDDEYRIADAFATAALARFEAHGFGRWWEDGALPSVAAYYARMQERESWEAAEVLNEDLRYHG